MFFFIIYQLKTYILNELLLIMCKISISSVKLTHQTKKALKITTNIIPSRINKFVYLLVNDRTANWGEEHCYLLGIGFHLTLFSKFIVPAM